MLKVVSKEISFKFTVSWIPAKKHADKFENLRFKSWWENCSQNTAGIQETTNTRELWPNSFMFIFWQTRETEL
jgi:hypothetical protein